MKAMRISSKSYVLDVSVKNRFLSDHHYQLMSIGCQCTLELEKYIICRKKIIDGYANSMF